jgi:hypothetical protein
MSQTGKSAGRLSVQCASLVRHLAPVRRSDTAPAWGRRFPSQELSADRQTAAHLGAIAPAKCLTARPDPLPKALLPRPRTAACVGVKSQGNPAALGAGNSGTPASGRLRLPLLTRTDTEENRPTSAQEQIKDSAVPAAHATLPSSRRCRGTQRRESSERLCALVVPTEPVKVIALRA